MCNLGDPMSLRHPVAREDFNETSKRRVRVSLLLLVSLKSSLATGWRRLKGSPKLHIIFHKRATKYRSLLQKTTYQDKGSYECNETSKRRLTRSLLLLVSLHKAATNHRHYEKKPPIRIIVIGAYSNYTGQPLITIFIERSPYSSSL